MPEAGPPDHRLVTKGMSMSRKKFLHVSGWSLRRKLALVLAFPIVFAVTVGTAFVTTEWIATRDHKAAASQVNVLPAAVEFLDAAENAAVVARRKTSAVDPERDAAVQKVDDAATNFEASAADAGLTDQQREQVESILDLSQQLRSNDGYVSVGQSVSQVRQLHQGITQLIADIVNEQAEPEPKLPLLTQTLDGRLALAMQQFQVAYDKGSTANPVDVSAEIGVEGAAIDRLGASLGLDDERVMSSSTRATPSGSERSGPAAWTWADPRPTSRTTRSPTTFSPTSTASWPRRPGGHASAPSASAVVTGMCLLVAVLIALTISRTMLRQIRTVRDGAIHVANEEPARDRRTDPGGRGPRRDHPDRRHHRGGDGAARPRLRRPPPPGDHAGLRRGGAAVAGRATCSRPCRDATPP